MEVTETKVTKINIQCAGEEPFFNFGKFIKIRCDLGMHTDNMHHCLVCGRKFKDDENIYLVITDHGNRLVCKECNKKILETLKKEKL